MMNKKNNQGKIAQILFFFWSGLCWRGRVPINFRLLSPCGPTNPFGFPAHTVVTKKKDHPMATFEGWVATLYIFSWGAPQDLVHTKKRTKKNGRLRRPKN